MISNRSLLLPFSFPFPSPTLLSSTLVVSLSLALFLLATPALSAPTLVQLVTLHRHGAREPLQKDLDDVAEVAGANILYPAGVNQLLQMGEDIKARFEDFIANIPLPETSKDGRRNLFVLSSNIGRTLSSARAFQQGMFRINSQDPRSLTVPIYTIVDKNNDVVIRGYQLCPKFKARVKELFKSSEFAQKAAQSEQLRIKWAGLLNERDAMDNWLTVYDRLQLAKNYGQDSANGYTIPDEEYSQAKELADWITAKMYSTETAQNLIGGVTLSYIYNRMNALAEFDRGNLDPSNPDHALLWSWAHDFVEISGHYPTILGLYAAMELPKTTETQRIPGFCESVVFELWRDDGGSRGSPANTYTVKIGIVEGAHHQDDNLRSARPIRRQALGRGSCTDPEAGCPLSEFYSLLQSNMLWNYTYFCPACENTESPICIFSNALQTGGGGTQTPSDLCECQSMSNEIAGLIGATVTLAVCAIFAALVYFCFLKSHTSSAPKTDMEQAALPTQHEQQFNMLFQEEDHIPAEGNRS